MKKLNLLFLSLFIIGLISSQSLLGQTNGDFRSTGNGTWKTLSTWQTYSGGWIAATSVPDSFSTGAVTIRSSDTVTVSDSTGVRNVTVNGGLNVTGNGTVGFLKIATLRGTIPI